MPTYEYLCETCSHRFEAWQKMSEEPLQVCPECGHHIRRVFYPAGIVFKGSGFYKTDHGKGSVPEGKKPEGNGSESNNTNGKDGANGANGSKPASESKTSEGSSSNASSSSSSGDSKVATSTGA